MPRLHLSILLLLVLVVALPATEGTNTAATTISLDRVMTGGDPNRDPNWDWTINTGYTLYTTGGTYSNIDLPYYSSSGPASADLNVGTGRDISQEHGWELVLRDFGTSTDDIALPFYILYNRYRGILRFFYFSTYDQSYSSAIGRLHFQGTTESTTLANFTLSDEDHQYLDNYYINGGQVALGGIARHEWCYLDFDVSGYDPDTHLKNVTYIIEITARTDSDVFISGEVSLLGGTVSATQTEATASNAFNLAGAYSEYENAQKRYKDAQATKTKIESWAEDNETEPIAEFITSVAALGLTEWIPAMAVAVGLTKAIIGGGSSNSSVPAPYFLDGEIVMDGTIATSTTLYSKTIRAPGSIHSDPENDALNNLLPLYDKPLGLFNLYSQPVHKYYVTEYLSGQCDDYGYCIGANRIKTIIHRTPSLAYAINPHADLELASIKAAYVSPGQLPDGYTSLTNNGYHDLENFFQITTSSQVNSQAPACYNTDCGQFDIETDPAYFIPAFARDIALHLTLNTLNGDSQNMPVNIVRRYEPDYVYGYPTTLPSLSGTISSNTTISSDRRITGTLYVSNNATLTISAGTNIYLNSGVNIIVNPGAKIIANGDNDEPIRFMRYDPDNQWGKIELRSDAGNEFSWCLFDGGNYTLHIRSRYNTISNCTFRNGNRGISSSSRYGGGYSSYDIHETMIENNSVGMVNDFTFGKMTSSTIRGNTSYGIRLYNAQLGADYSLGGVFSENHVYDNGSYGIYLGSNGKLWLAYGSTEGNNRIANNGSHEVYLGSMSARLYQSTSSPAGGYSDIYDDLSSSPGYYIYNLAQTFNGETYLSLTQKAENNYWGSSTGPSAARFFGSVDYSPYKDEPQAYYSGAMNSTLGMELDEERRDQVYAGVNDSERDNLDLSEGLTPTFDISQNARELMDNISSNKNDPMNARRLLDLYSTNMMSDPLDQAGEKSNILSFVNRRLEIQGSSPLRVNKLEAELAAMIRVDAMVQAGEYTQAISAVSETLNKIENLDMQRELRMLSISAKLNLGQYQSALDELQALKEHVEVGNVVDYSPPDFTHLEEDIMVAMSEGNVIAQQPQISAEINDPLTPATFTLANIFPNPFNPSTTIPVITSTSGDLTLTLYDIKGRQIRTIFSSTIAPGNHQIHLDGSDLYAGLYFVKAYFRTTGSTSTEFQATEKLLLVK